MSRTRSARQKKRREREKERGNEGSRVKTQLGLSQNMYLFFYIFGWAFGLYIFLHIYYIYLGARAAVRPVPRGGAARQEAGERGAMAPGELPVCAASPICGATRADAWPLSRGSHALATQVRACGTQQRAQAEAGTTRPQLPSGDPWRLLVASRVFYILYAPMRCLHQSCVV